MSPATPADTTFIIVKKNLCGSGEAVCLQMIPRQKYFTYLSLSYRINGQTRNITLLAY
jgi:hypothetical protein